MTTLIATAPAWLAFWIIAIAFTWATVAMLLAPIVGRALRQDCNHCSTTGVLVEQGDGSWLEQDVRCIFCGGAS